MKLHPSLSFVSPNVSVLQWEKRTGWPGTKLSDKDVGEGEKDGLNNTERSRTGLKETEPAIGMAATMKCRLNLDRLPKKSDWIVFLWQKSPVERSMNYDRLLSTTINLTKEWVLVDILP